MTTSTQPSTPPRERLVARVCLTAVAAVALVGVSAGSASADPGLTDTGTTVVSTEVGSAITMTGLTAAFTLTGIPGATVTGLGAVGLNVHTNNLAGYAVTVESQTATLIAATPANTDSVPIGALSVREGGTTDYTALSNTVPVTVHTQTTKSLEAGDNLVNDYRVVIPFVNEDTYVATLDYVATTL